MIDSHKQVQVQVQVHMHMQVQVQMHDEKEKKKKMTVKMDALPCIMRHKYIKVWTSIKVSNNTWSR